MAIRCSVKPYEGDENYVFISYCHKDKKFIFPIVERLAKDGYRVWYDEGIDPGSEWPEVIASHLNSGSVCIAFISKNSLESHNCKREINFALLKRKPFISVILEEVQLSLGMEMQLSATQAIFKYTLTEAEFYSKLYSSGLLVDCLGVSHDDIKVSSPEDYDEPDEGKLRDPFSFGWFYTAEQPKVKALEESENSLEKDTEFHAVILCCKTGKVTPLNEVQYRLGRSDKQCNFIVPGNSSVGRYHARITKVLDRWYLMDNNSVNGTLLNHKKLVPEYEYQLHDGDTIGIANEKYIFEIRKV